MDGDLERELIDKARRGDPSAAPFLVSCFGERLLGFARAHAPDLSDADRESIVEFAIEAGVRAIDKYDPARGSLEAWFRGQVRFQTLGHRRHAAAMTELNDQLEDPSPDQPNPPVETASVIALRRVISQLAPDEQRILALHNVERIGFAEIGQRIGISEDAARQRHHRARKRLRLEAMAEPELQHLVKEAGE